MKSKSNGKRETASHHASLSMAERRSIAEETLDPFTVLRSRRTPWRVPELATQPNVDKRSIYEAVATGELSAIYIGTSLQINPADTHAWVEAGTTGLRSSCKEAV